MDNRVAIHTIYKNAKIEFDLDKEEWVAYLNLDYNTGEEEFARHESLKKLKDAIDRFNRKEFKPIPIIFFDSNGEITYADIVSFTAKPGECFIKYNGGVLDGQRKKLSTNDFHTRKIYALENVKNEPKLIEILAKTQEIEEAKKNYVLKQAERFQMISQLDVFDITGYALTAENEENNQN